MQSLAYLYHTTSLIPRPGGGRGEKVASTHCLRMCVIIAKAT